MYHVEYFNEHDERWCGVYSPVSPFKRLAEADRLARERSSKSRRVFRVRKGLITVRHWKAGLQTKIARLT